MFPYAIILPVCDNAGEGVSFAHDILESALAVTFGGVTFWPVQGGWFDLQTNKMVREESIRYVAYGDESKASAFMRIALDAGERARQVCVAIETPRGAELLYMSEETQAEAREEIAA